MTREQLVYLGRLGQMDPLDQRVLPDMVGSRENMAVMDQKEQGEKREKKERWESLECL